MQLSTTARALPRLFCPTAGWMTHQMAGQPQPQHPHRPLRRARSGWLKRLGLAALALGLSACAGLPRPQGPATVSMPGEAGPLAASWACSGRMSLRWAATPTQPAGSVTAAFELRTTGQAHEIDLSTPLGTTLARAHWGPNEAWLDQPRKARQHYPDASSLALDALGQPFPLQALPDWLQGQAWPGAAVQSQGPRSLTQLSWALEWPEQAGVLRAYRPQPEPEIKAHIRLDAPCTGAAPPAPPGSGPASRPEPPPTAPSNPAP
jgi:outer membrane lipoprotein LolB